MTMIKIHRFVGMDRRFVGTGRRFVGTGRRFVGTGRDLSLRIRIHYDAWTCRDPSLRYYQNNNPCFAH